ncbi:hypothetical protein GCM10010038_06180 [Glutamicibacter protophormiae]|nr:hypothetical protein GCM10010038_06180 [Glutamicibacter protophormiae]
MSVPAAGGAATETGHMWKTSISPVAALTVAVLFAGIGIWRASEAEPWQGGAMFALAAFWVAVAMRQARKGER